MSDEDKTRLELANFENFLRIAKISFDHYESQRPPEPDIAARRGDDWFGIEITNFHRQDEKRKESEEDRVLDAAWDLYNRKRGPDLLLHLMWAPHFKLQKKDRQSLAEKIADVALRHPPRAREWLTMDWQYFDRDLMGAVDHISLYGMPGGMRAHWSCARGRFVPEWDATQLQVEIDRKKNKPRQYHGKYKEIWLLIVSPFGSPSSWMEMNAEVRTTEFASLFDKIFILSSFPLEVVELHSKNNRSRV